MRDFMSDRQATRMNEILYLLTLVSTIMLPLTFITGLLGLNIVISGGSVRGISNAWALLAVCAALTIVGWLGYQFPSYEARRGILTANATTPYYLGFADLSTGPRIYRRR